MLNNEKLQARLSRRRLLKLFTAEGIARYSDVEVTETPGYDLVRNLSGRTILPDGTVVPLEQDNISVKTVYKQGKRRLRVKAARFAGVVPGSIIEYAYDMVDPRVSNYVRYRWEVQEEIPVLTSKLALKPGEVQLGWVQQGLESFALDSKHPFKNVYHFTVSDMPSMPDEPFPPPPDFVSASVLFYPASGHNLWMGLFSGFVARNAGEFLQKADAVAAKVKELVPRDDPPLQKMKTIYRFVQEKIGTEEDRAAETAEENLKDAENADQVLARGFGSEYERTLLFIAMAAKAGLDAQLVLAADRRERILNPALANYDDFSSYLAGVKTSAKWSFYDPATRYCPFGTIAAHKEGGVVNAMIVKPAQIVEAVRKGFPALPLTAAYTLFELPSSAAGRNVLLREATVRLSADGSGEVEVSDQGTGLVDLGHRDAYLKLDDAARRERLSEGLRESVPGATLLSASFEDLDSYANTATIRYRFSAPAVASRVAGRMLLAPSLLEAARPNPFAAEKRRTPVHFPHAIKTIARVEFELPAGFAVSEKPEDDSFREGPFAYAAEYEQADGKVIYARRLEIDASAWPADEYPRLRSFSAKVQEADRRVVVLAPEKEDP